MLSQAQSLQLPQLDRQAKPLLFSTIRSRKATGLDVVPGVLDHLEGVNVVVGQPFVDMQRQG